MANEIFRNTKRNAVFACLDWISRNLDPSSSKLHNYFLISDFSTSIQETALKNFCESHERTYVLQKPK